MATTPPVPPPGYQVEPQQQLANVPDFLKPTAQQVTAVPASRMSDNLGTVIADVPAWNPHEIQVRAPELFGQPEATHEISHSFQMSRSIPAIIDQAADRWAGRTSGGYDYGGIDGLETALNNHKTMADFGPEQQADIIKDFQQQTQDAIKSGNAADLDRVNRVYGPFAHQFANMPARGDNSAMNVTPAAPGLPPAEQSGILAADKLLSSDAKVLKHPPGEPDYRALDALKHPHSQHASNKSPAPKPPPGYQLDAHAAEK